MTWNLLLLLLLLSKELVQDKRGEYKPQIKHAQFNWYTPLVRIYHLSRFQRLDSTQFQFSFLQARINFETSR